MYLDVIWMITVENMRLHLPVDRRHNHLTQTSFHKREVEEMIRILHNRARSTSSHSTVPPPCRLRTKACRKIWGQRKQSNLHSATHAKWRHESRGPKWVNRIRIGFKQIYFRSIQLGFIYVWRFPSTTSGRTQLHNSFFYQEVGGGIESEQNFEADEHRGTLPGHTCWWHLT